MQWQDFFKLVVHFENSETAPFFSADLPTPKDFDFESLLVKNFDHLKLNTIEKKKFTLNVRKIVICHELFESKEFKIICDTFAKKIANLPDDRLIFSTQGGGIYLFLSLIKHPLLKNKKILVFTSELPIRSESKHYSSAIQFIYRPHAKSYLSDFSSLWKNSKTLSLFELKVKKAAA